LHESILLLENRHPYQGRTNAEVAKLGDRAYDADVLGTDGETIQDLRDRLARFLRLVARRHTGGVVAAVSHADPIAALRAHLLGIDLAVASLRKEAPPLASVFRMEFGVDEKPQIEWFWKPPAPPPSEKPASDNGAKSDQSGPAAVEPA